MQPVNAEKTFWCQMKAEILEYLTHIFLEFSKHSKSSKLKVENRNDYLPWVHLSDSYQIDIYYSPWQGLQDSMSFGSDRRVQRTQKIK